ncbi:hypothetical protein ROZALSC1DRAFT_31289 [Rozella allomycis CSF55]|uniref:Proteasome subunit Rpn10 domain-containing protein n=1 Tax=Rozella allomycis (strain CSF55) TaxID=988480 RepID=A0A075AN44_ROZAC|nr:Proteasome subunit Rpn10 domain-containing protein [Rozella allomycis CSF55]RKP16853.1 hypothetical protein ROZALSC1DRAFT_31289 [Rozella allomycis CSF55]|eukprot:EPZ31143.1 Proteasome subunit Rpn10 domain-containing protein [Rozella allomycis CSF55]
MRNGDYFPNRFDAQKDGVQLVFNAKFQGHQENTVGVLAMAGKAPEVLVTCTNTRGQVLNALHEMKVGGKIHFAHGIQIAQLALKHRLNKNQSQRIVAFVGSPITDTEEELIKLGKKLKKNGVAVDVVNFGEENENNQILVSFINNVNSNDNSHLVTIPPGTHQLSDMLVATPIVSSDGVIPSNPNDFEFGIDPSLDPELALALRISMEEERARQNQQEGGPYIDQPMETDEDEELRRALAMSMQDATSAEQDMTSMLQDLPGLDQNDPRVKDALNPNKSPKKDK